MCQREERGGRPKVNQPKLIQASDLCHSQRMRVHDIQEATGISAATLYRKLNKRIGYHYEFVWLTFIVEHRIKLEIITWIFSSSCLRAGALFLAQPNRMLIQHDLQYLFNPRNTEHIVKTFCSTYRGYKFEVWLFIWAIGHQFFDRTSLLEKEKVILY